MDGRFGAASLHAGNVDKLRNLNDSARSRFKVRITGAGITVHTNPCERLLVRVAVACVALRQCCAYAVCVCHCQ